MKRRVVFTESDSDTDTSERRSVQLSIVDSLKLMGKNVEGKSPLSKKSNTIEKYFSPKQKASKIKEISVDDFFGGKCTTNSKAPKHETPPCSPTTFIPDTPVLSSKSCLNEVNLAEANSSKTSKHKSNAHGDVSPRKDKHAKKENWSPVSVSPKKTPSSSKVKLVPETPQSDKKPNRVDLDPLSLSDMFTDIGAESSSKKTPQKSQSTKIEPENSPKLNKSLSSPHPSRPSEDRKPYWAYKARDGPRHLGSREIPKRRYHNRDMGSNPSELSSPDEFQRERNRLSNARKGLVNMNIHEGSPQCLKNLTFLITGILETIERDDAVALIERCGGKVMKTLGKKTNYLIIGREPGESKLAKAEDLKIKQLTEDEFFDLVLARASTDTGTSSPPKNRAPVKAAAKTSTTQLTARPVLLPSANGPTCPDHHKIDSHKVETTMSTTTAKPANKTHELWVDKYRPSSFRSLIGLAGPASPANKLFAWLSTWHEHFGAGYLSLVQGLKAKAYNSAPPWGNSNDDGRWARAVLLSGPPGIGKTSSATLVCHELGFTVAEFNASDCRSKRYLSEELSLSLKTRNLSFGNASTGLQLNLKHHAIIMDEVDGMAGNEDRGGMQELINMIKITHIPIICICNDRQSQKVRSLANYCFDLRFHRPRVEQIKAALLSILCKEGVTVPNNILTDIIQASNQDIRQVINNVQMWCTSMPANSDQLSQDAAGARKDLRLTPFEIIRKVFAPDISGPTGGLASFNDSLDLFFQDYSLIPLFVQENYLNVKLRDVQNPNKALQLLSQAANDMAMGDIVSKSIRASGTGSWSLLPVQGVFSVLRPGRMLRGSLPGGPGGVSFPSWFGKNSSQNRLSRVTTDLATHLRLSVQTSSITSKGLLLDYASPMAMALSRPLKEGDVNTVVQLMEHYNLSRDDFDSILELATWSSQPNRIAGVDSKVKAALTRTINKSTHLLPYALSSGGIKSHRGSSSAQSTAQEFEDDEESAGLFDDTDSPSQNGESDFKNDAMIMVKKPSSRSTSSKSTTSADNKPTTCRSKGSSSRGGGGGASGRGRGRPKS